MSQLPDSDFKIEFPEAQINDLKKMSPNGDWYSILIGMLVPLAEISPEELQKVYVKEGDNAVIIVRSELDKHPALKKNMEDQIKAGKITPIAIETSGGSTVKSASHFSKYKNLYIGGGVLLVAGGVIYHMRNN